MDVLEGRNKLKHAYHTFHAYIPKKAMVSADHTNAKDFQKKGIVTLSKGTSRNR
jgi:hypothetical protein